MRDELQMPEIKVPDPQRRWIMCDEHEFRVHGKSYDHLEQRHYGSCKHCGMPISNRSRGSIDKDKPCKYLP